MLVSAVNFSEDEDKQPPYFHLTGGEVRLNVAQKATLETNSRFSLKTDKDTFSITKISLQTEGTPAFATKEADLTKADSSSGML